MTDVLITSKDPFPIVKRTLDKIVDIVAPTYGPAANKVIIKKATHRLVVDDGVQIMRDLEFADPNEHAVLEVVREVAVKTNDLAGDGTTGATIVAHGIVDAAAKLRRRDGHKIERDLKVAVAEAKEQLRAEAKPIKTLEDLTKVARVSYNNEEVAKVIAETWHKVGKDGVVTVDTGNITKVTSELSEGIKLEHGYISPFMVTNPERMEAVIEKPYILITDYRLMESDDLIPVMNKLAKEAKSGLVVIAENVEDKALATLIINEPHVVNPHTRQLGKMLSVAVVADGGDDRVNKLADIAMLTGATFFSKDGGHNIKNAEIKDLGRADRFVAKQTGAVIVGPKGKAADIKKAVADLVATLNLTDKPKEKERLERRIAFFSNKIAVIKVGAATDNEQKALKYKVEDAVNAVRSAFRGGVVCGSGLSLTRLNTSSELLNEALKAPNRRLMDNMGIDLPRPLEKGEAYNVVTGEIGKWLEVGVIDPVDVLIAGIESAASIASLLLTTSGMVVEKPQKIRHG